VEALPRVEPVPVVALAPVEESAPVVESVVVPAPEPVVPAVPLPPAEPDVVCAMAGIEANARTATEAVIIFFIFSLLHFGMSCTREAREKPESSRARPSLATLERKTCVGAPQKCCRK
jgi:hypothetical protein